MEVHGSFELLVQCTIIMRKFLNVVIYQLSPSSSRETCQPRFIYFLSSFLLLLASL